MVWREKGRPRARLLASPRRAGLGPGRWARAHGTCVAIRASAPEKANKVFGKHSARLLAVFTTGGPSSSAAGGYRRRLLHGLLHRAAYSTCDVRDTVIVNVIPNTESALAADSIAKLPSSWRSFATALKHKRTKISVEELIASLDVEEKARAKDTKGGESHSVANTVQNQRNQGKGKGKFKPNKTTNFKKKNKAKLLCFTCGHKRLLRLMGNGSAASVLGTGTVDLKFTSGKIVQLKNVQHVPSMNKNLVSGSLLLRDGFKVVLESNKVVVSRHGLFIGKGYVSGGLFRLSFSDFSNKRVNHICGGVNDDTSLWHGRLCHIAFLNGELEEEIYMEQPDGFVVKSQESKVCKLLKSLYGLKQAPKQWHEKFDTTLISAGFAVNEADSYVYYRYGGGKRVILCLYVDDILIFGTDIDVINEVKSFLSTKFDMKDLGEADVILNKFIKNESGITLSQTHYVEKVLSRFGYIDSKSSPTPYDPNMTLKKNKRIGVNQLKYSQIIGSLMYLASATRPDISFAVCKLSRFMSNPDWLRELLMDLPVVDKPIPAILMNCDNQTAIAKMNSDKENAKSSRHVRRRVKSIRKMRYSGVINITYIQTKKNLEDPFTKGLSRNVIDIASREMGLRPI
ncbi:hypothetical protein U9M48_042002 [Paspalum notatum var. saurae]|uniref:Reverse transcriptase Ty1/copia-type domain-containing protein n=1 Tax=Paspalum notatum var. saurae TaxID=547442 RepID=A0AAQ3UUF0_PASNO